jgi:hypothetical protein
MWRKGGEKLEEEEGDGDCTGEQNEREGKWGGSIKADLTPPRTNQERTVTTHHHHNCVATRAIPTTTTTTTT